MVANFSTVFLLAFVGEGVQITNGCVIGSGTRLTECEDKMADHSVYYGDPLRHRIAAEKPAVLVTIFS